MKLLYEKWANCIIINKNNEFIIITIGAKCPSITKYRL